MMPLVLMYIIYVITLLLCIVCDCAGVLDDVPSGYAEVSRGTIYGSLIEYRCDEGYEIGSNALRICGAGDVLLGTMPTCSSKLKMVF